MVLDAHRLPLGRLVCALAPSEYQCIRVLEAKG